MSIVGFFVVSSIALAVTLVFALDGKFNNHEGKIYIIWPKHLLKDHSIITSAKRWVDGVRKWHFF